MLKSVKAKAATRRIPFLAHVADAEEVRVTGDFIHWVKEGISLSHDGRGKWRTVLPLDPGEYQYRLLVDGEWKDHAEATERVVNPFGSKNCILKVL